MKIPYTKLGKETLPNLESFIHDIPNFLASGQFILGETVTTFEKSFAIHQGTKHAVSVNSGFDALFLTLLACGVGPGDEVITAPNSFIATAAAIVHTGAKPVFVDVCDDRNINPKEIERWITHRTKAIIPIHLAGRPARMGEISDFAARIGVTIIEDCAQAVGSLIHGQPVGSIGRAGCFSFHPLKNLAALGDGGCIVTNDDELADSLRLLRNHGLLDRNTTSCWGFNSRLDSLQALWLLQKLVGLEGILTKRKDNARRYLKELADIPGLVLPKLTSDLVHTWHAFVIEVDQRKELQAHLANKGIEALIHYPVPIHLQPAALQLGYGPGSFPVCEQQASRILSLPIRDSLERDEISQVVTQIRIFFQNS
ncbi:dTDP-3-amino-3,4,6-trideoxy-alpha-D-glucose transaminase [Pseudomonas fluorescens]|nr:dTDP-3-amino-3,4,6-trideoxy-alpha-D-glucose transaminase [Pseudomonas fluorescens]